MKAKTICWILFFIGLVSFISLILNPLKNEIIELVFLIFNSSLMVASLYSNLVFSRFDILLNDRK